jgi:hypothetical protein
MLGKPDSGGGCMNMHEPFDYLFEFLSELELEFP